MKKKLNVGIDDVQNVSEPSYVPSFIFTSFLPIY